MKICRFKSKFTDVRIGLIKNDNSSLVDLTAAGIRELQPLLENGDSVSHLKQIDQSDLPSVSLNEVRLCAPVEKQEVWAAGVTYLRSKTARMEESDFSATAYDR